MDYEKIAHECNDALVKERQKVAIAIKYIQTIAIPDCPAADDIDAKFSWELCGKCTDDVDAKECWEAFLEQEAAK